MIRVKRHVQEFAVGDTYRAIELFNDKKFAPQNLTLTKISQFFPPPQPEMLYTIALYYQL